MPQISNPKNDRRSLTQAGHEVGDSNVALHQNTANTNSPVLEWTCPRKFSQIRYAGGTHKTKFVPRTKETQSAPSPSGGTVTFSLNSQIQPIHGETLQEDQQYPPVVAYNKTQDTEVMPESYDYGTNDVTFPDTNIAQNDDIALFSILVEGTLQYRGIDQFDHEIAPLYNWSEPIHVFHDFEQDRNETQVHLVGQATWEESETLALYIDSPHQIVWEDSDYPRGQYVSVIEQRVDVTV